MALQTSGQISLNEIHVEAGGTTGTEASFNDTDIRGLISASSASEMEMADWYGAANEVTLTSGGNVNGQAQRKQITISSFISSGGTLVIPSNIWIWSDSTSTPALTIDIPCTVKNSGKIIGRGGNGGTFYSSTNGGGGGHAIKINSGVSGVTIINNSGAYIAGGGGGGSGLGGGGAGGGSGGRGSVGGTQTGGSLNAKGNPTSGFSSAYYSGQYPTGRGGGAGGGGGAYDDDGSDQGSGGGGGGGRQLPGSGGYGAGQQSIGVTWANGYSGYGNNQGGAGGSAGGTRYYKKGGGGGGWGASGGNGYAGSAGSGGKAVNDSGNSYTLTNNGTVYGGT